MRLQEPVKTIAYIVLLARSGDDRSRQFLYDQVGSMINEMARTIESIHLASDDITSIAIESIDNAINTYCVSGSSVGKFTTYACRVGMNRILDKLRQVKRQNATNFSDIDQFVESPSREMVDTRHELNEVARQVLGYIEMGKTWNQAFHACRNEIKQACMDKDEIRSSIENWALASVMTFN